MMCTLSLSRGVLRGADQEQLSAGPRPLQVVLRPLRPAAAWPGEGQDHGRGGRYGHDLRLLPEEVGTRAGKGS